MPQEQVQLNWARGAMQGTCVRTSCRTLGGLQRIFRDQDAWRFLNPETVVYRVELWLPVAEGTEGGLFWGVTTIEPGLVGDEYFMTQGHLHAVRNRAEFYCAAEGEGLLLLMDADRKTRAEAMEPGSLHYIPGDTAHRVVNIGTMPLRFWACWPSDAGHEYDAILREGFSARVLRRDGVPALVQELIQH